MATGEAIQLRVERRSTSLEDRPPPAAWAIREARSGSSPRGPREHAQADEERQNRQSSHGGLPSDEQAIPADQAAEFIEGRAGCYPLEGRQESAAVAERGWDRTASIGDAASAALGPAPIERLSSIWFPDR
jgi:hypothetical protein